MKPWKVKGANLTPMAVASMLTLASVFSSNGRARAQAPCARIVVPTTVSDAWARAVADLRAEVAKLPASGCQKMTLSLELRQGEMRLVAETIDGRRAGRNVNRAESLVPMALGLLMTIPEAAPPLAGASTAPEPPDGVPPSLASDPTRVKALTPIALWAGLSGGIRLTSPTQLTVLDIEARADILFDRWLMLITLRSSVASCLGQQGLDCDVYNDVSVGAGVGRRFRVGVPDIDVGFEPSVVVMHMEYDRLTGAEGQTIQGTEVVLRLDASARLAVPLNQHWALTFTLDGGLAPAMLTSPARLDLPTGTPADSKQLPPFPAWSGGVRLGATGALL